MPLVDLSFGDALDRLSVLKVKMKSLNDDYCKFGIVSKEASQLEDAILSWCHNNNISNELYEKHLSTLVEILDTNTGHSIATRILDGTGSTEAIGQRLQFTGKGSKDDVFYISPNLNSAGDARNLDAILAKQN